MQHGEFFQHRRERSIKFFEILERKHLAGNLAEDGRNTVFLVEKVRAKAGNVRNFVAEIDVARFFEGLDLLLRRDFVEHRLQGVVFQRWKIDALKLAVNAEHGRVAR